MSRLANNPQNTQFTLSVESPEVETRTVEAWAHGRQAGRRVGRQAVWLLSEPKLQLLTYLFVTHIYLGYMHVSGENNPPFLFS